MPQLVYQGLLRSPVSWARVGRGFLGELAARGRDVAAVATRGFRFDPAFPLPAGVAEISAGRLRDGPEPPVGLGFLHPPRLDRLRGQRRCNLFVWEADRVPTDWIPWLRDHTDRVIVPGAFTRDALIDTGLDASRIAVVPFGYSAASIPEVRPPRGDRFRILAVLAPHWRKGVGELLRAYRAAFSRRDPVELLLKSTYDPADLRRRKPFEIPGWQVLLEELGLQATDAPRVELDLRVLDDAEILTLMAHADLYVQPSWGEAFGLGLLEALACGTPGIATGWGGVLEFFPEGPDRLPFTLGERSEASYAAAPGARVAIPDVDALVERLRWHFEHREASRHSGERQRKAVAGFTWSRAAQALAGTLALDDPGGTPEATRHDAEGK